MRKRASGYTRERKKNMQSYRKIAMELQQGKTVYRETKIEEERYLRETFGGKQNLVICGGGHISQPLCSIGKMLGFFVTIIDDREEFANIERFSQADEVYCIEFVKALGKLEFSDNTFYVIVTRGHQNDYECLSAILRRKSSYIGMIGSRAKVKATFERLCEDGFSEEQRSAVHAPIGLSIGANTPEEIAVSIMAEIIQEKSKLGLTEMPQEVINWLLERQEEMMMLTIVEKRGSAPRGVGARMLVAKDGKAAGTIGGGAIEYLASQKAVQLLKDGRERELQAYNLTTKEAVNIGMICGGYVEVLFEKVAI